MYEQLSNRSTQKELRGSNEVHSRIEEISIRIQRGVESVEKERNRQELSQHEREDFERRIVFDYAKENGLWIDDLYSLGVPTGVGGNENTLVIDVVNSVLYKSNNLFNSKYLISNLLIQTQIHNQLFPEAEYKLVGFTGIDNGSDQPPYVEVILKQDYVPNCVNATQEEILGFMLSLGFKQVGNASFSNGQYTVSDLHPRNVLKDANGFIHIVDDLIL